MSDDTTWFWTIVDAHGLANVSSDETVALREIIARAEAAEARVTALEAERAGLVKLADGYGIVLMMIAAGCSEPQRFAKRMLAEYAPEAKKLEATK